MYHRYIAFIASILNLCILYILLSEIRIVLQNNSQLAGTCVIFTQINKE
jgi:hypothetical protein